LQGFSLAACQSAAETAKWNEVAAEFERVGSLFPYFNYLVIPAIYIMYLAHRARHRLHRRGFPIGSTPSRIPNRAEGSAWGREGRNSKAINSFRLRIVITHCSLRYSRWAVRMPVICRSKARARIRFLGDKDSHGVLHLCIQKSRNTNKFIT